MTSEYMSYTVRLCESYIDHHLLAKSDSEALKMAYNGRFLHPNKLETVLMIRNNDTNKYLVGDATDYYDFDDEELQG